MSRSPGVTNHAAMADSVAISEKVPCPVCFVEAGRAVPPAVPRSPRKTMLPRVQDRFAMRPVFAPAAGLVPPMLSVDAGEQKGVGQEE